MSMEPLNKKSTTLRLKKQMIREGSIVNLFDFKTER